MTYINLDDLQWYRKSWWIEDQIQKGYIVDIEFPNLHDDSVVIIYTDENETKQWKKKWDSTYELRIYLWEHRGQITYWGKKR
jgi:hypothetical protein